MTIPPLGGRGDVTRLSVWVKPAARVDALGWDAWRERWVVSCRAAPVHGAANRAVAALLAEWLGVAPSAVRWIHSGAMRAKTLEIEGLSGVETTRRLRTIAGASTTGGDAPSRRTGPSSARALSGKSY